MDIHYFWQVFHTAPNDLFCPIAKKYCKQEGVYLSRTEHVVTIFYKLMIVVIRPFVWLFADTTAQVRLIVENWLPSLFRGLWSCLCNLSVTWVESTKGYNHWYGYSTGFRVVPCYWVETDLQNLDLWSAVKLYSLWVMTVLLVVTSRLLHSYTRGSWGAQNIIFFCKRTLGFQFWAP